MDEPPIQYIHPYAGQVIEQRLSQAEVIRLCHGGGACSSGSIRGRCHIIIPYDNATEWYRRHEIAHCNGWRHGR